MKVLYFHGYGSSKDSLTAKELAKHFDVKSITYRTDDAISAWKVLDEWVEREVMKDPFTILVGSSLGGFWANMFGQQYKLDTILINPSLNPCESLKKYIELSSGDLESYSLVQNNLVEFAVIPRKIFLGTEDKVVSFDRSSMIAISSKIIELQGEGHVLNDLTPVINSIIESYNQITDDPII